MVRLSYVFGGAALLGMAVAATGCPQSPGPKPPDGEGGKNGSGGASTASSSSGAQTTGTGGAASNSSSSSSTGTGGAASSSSSTGTGGAASSSSSSTGTGGAASSSSSSVSSSGSGVTCDPTVTCQSAITPGVDDPSKLCPGAEKDAYDALHTCTCNSGGKCSSPCGNDPWCAIMPMSPSAACAKCITDVMSGCGNEFLTCNM